MNRKLLLVLSFVCATLPLHLLAQQQVPLKKALDEVKAVYGTKFAYEENLLDNVMVPWKGGLTKKEPVENILKGLLYNKGFLFLYIQSNYYTIIKDTRSAREKEKNTDPSRPAETREELSDEYVQVLTGVVTDAGGNPLTGVTVLPEGFAVRWGVTTSSDGRYTLRLKEKTNALLFSFVGMVPQKVELNGRSAISVQLEPESKMLEEVKVVSTGYQSIPKERATGAFGQISSKEIKAVPAVNLMERLEGTTPGVRFDVRNNTIQIRGRNTLVNYGSSRPLIVIDGFPALDQDLAERETSVASIGTVLSRYNPEDIESITVLKDAAAASIWGANAANGVIVINTKKGKKNSSQVNFSTNLSISNPSDMGKLNRMNSAQYIELEKEMKDLGYFTDPINWDNSWMTFNQNRPVSEALEWMFKVDRGTATEKQRDSALAVLGNLDNRSQIRDHLMQRAVSQQYNLSFSGGGQNNTYYLSTNYTRDMPVYRSNKGESYFVNANLSNDLFNKRVTINTGINYNYVNTRSNMATLNAIGNGNLGLRPYEMLQDASGNPIARSILFRDEVAADFLAKGYLPWTYSPLQELNYNNTTTKDNRFRFVADINTKLTTWANFQLAGSLQRSNAQTIIMGDLQSYDTRVLLNTATTVGSNGKLVYGIPFGGKMINSHATESSYSLRGQLNINKSWKDFSLNAIGGTEIREQTSERYAQTRYGFDKDVYSSATWNPTVPYNTVFGWSSTLGYSDGAITKNINRALSYFGNAAFSAFDNRYTLSASLRFDDFSLLGISRDKRAKPLWSTGFKWNVSSEEFMRSVTWLTNLNLRLTYGTTGTLATSATNSAIINLGTDPLTNEPTGTVQQPANNSVSWELTKSWNLGLDFGLFNNRLTISADAYRKNTEDMLWTFPINSTWGWTSLPFNAATMKGNGYELGLRAEVIRAKDFAWASTFNISYNTNEITDSRFKKPTAINLVGGGNFVQGEPLDAVYAYRWAGLDNKGRSQIYDANGKIITADQFNNVLKTEDIRKMGRSTPPFFGGWFNDFQYKSFTLGIRITYEMGHVFRRLSIENYPDFSTNNYAGLIGSQKDLALRWRRPGDEAFTNVPGLPNVSFLSSNRYKMSDLLVESASHIRLQQISLGYQIPSQLLQRIAFKSANLNFSVRNLGLIWKKNKAGVDPSYIASTNYNNLPPAPSFYMGMNLSF